MHGVFQRAGLLDGGVIPLSTAVRNDQAGYVRALTAYRYDGDARTPALNHDVDCFLTFVETATATAEVFADHATAPSLLIRPCSLPTTRGPCQNRVPVAGRHCWRHPRQGAGRPSEVHGQDN